MQRVPRKEAGEQFTYTKLYDLVAAQVGTVNAIVYGVVHRHCQMRDGVCRASMRRLAALVNLDPATVLRHLHELVEAGYLEDLTPDRRNKPHIYRDTFLGSAQRGSARYPRPEE